MPSFHTLTIKDIRRETDQCVSISFNIPAELKEEFAYKQGQYLTIRLTVNGEQIRRSYSLCSAPNIDAEPRIAVKAIENGRASAYLNNGIKPGDTLDVMRPMGNFYVEMPPTEQLHIVAFAAGSGITPIMSLLKTALNANDNNKFTLFYGNRSQQEVIFKDELTALQNKFGNRLEVHHILSRESTADPLFQGRISAEKCSELMAHFSDTQTADHYFLCGPFDMINAIRSSMKQKGISDEKVHFELFTTEAPDEDKKQAAAEESGLKMVASSQVTVVLDGEETVVTVTNKDNILNAVLDSGLDAPYACTGGSCCTCRAKVLKGKAIMDVNYALTEKEVAAGYILTCQSHPTTSEMVVDYDAP
jgi:ring-1,2-phenylacetyl-CoA epoxidase subunit PaaE